MDLVLKTSGVSKASQGSNPCPSSRGEVAEWSKAVLCYSIERNSSVGSNPTFSAERKKMNPEKYNKIFDSIEQDIDLIDEIVERLSNGKGEASPYQPHAGSVAIAELLKAKALLIKCL